MRLERDLARTPAGLAVRIAQRILALTLGILLNTLTGRPARALAAYDGAKSHQASIGNADIPLRSSESPAYTGLSSESARPRTAGVGQSPCGAARAARDPFRFSVWIEVGVVDADAPDSTAVGLQGGSRDVR
jgi:hypothetical protein